MTKGRYQRTITKSSPPVIHFIDRLQICWPIIMAMAGADWVGSEIKKLVPGAIVEVSDLHGTGDHFHVRVISDSFDGMLL